jgi:hypothetical protein
MSILIDNGVCQLQQVDAPFEELQIERERLRQMEALEPLLTAAQRRIYALEVDPQGQLVRSLEAKVAAAHGGGIDGSWLIVIKDESTGHLFGTAIVRGRKD